MARKQARGLPIPASPSGGGVEMTSEMAAISLQRRTRGLLARKKTKDAMGLSRRCRQPNHRRPSTLKRAGTMTLMAVKGAPSMSDLRRAVGESNKRLL